MFPELANLAHDILAIPISTVASKSAFTTGEKLLIVVDVRSVAAYLRCWFVSMTGHVQKTEMVMLQ